MVSQNMFGTTDVQWSPSCPIDNTSLSISQVDLVDLLLCSNNDTESPCNTEVQPFTQLTQAEYETHDVYLNEMAKQSSCTRNSTFVAASEIASMLKILQYLRTQFPSWASHEQNWRIHKGHILHLNNLDEGIRESYRAVFQLITQEYNSNEMLYTINDLQELMECLDLLKMPVSETYRGRLEFCNYVNDRISICSSDMKVLDTSGQLYNDTASLNNNNIIKHEERSSALREVETEVLLYTHAPNDESQIRWLGIPSNDEEKTKNFFSLYQTKNTKFTIEDIGTKISLDAIGFSETIRHKSEQQPFEVELNMAEIQSTRISNSYNCRPKRERKRSAKYMNSLSSASSNTAKSAEWLERSYPLKNSITSDTLEDKEFCEKPTTAVTISLNERSLPSEFQSGVKGVVWNRHRQVWEATWKSTNGKRCWVSFRADKYGFDEAKRLAIQYKLKESRDSNNNEILKNAQQQTNYSIFEGSSLVQNKLDVSEELQLRKDALPNIYEDKNSDYATFAEEKIKDTIKEEERVAVSSMPTATTKDCGQTEIRSSCQESELVSCCNSNNHLLTNGSLNYNVIDMTCVTTDTSYYNDDQFTTRNTCRGKVGVQYETFHVPGPNKEIKTVDLNSSIIAACLKNDEYIPAAKSNIRSNTGILGVCRDSMGRWYTAHMTVNGKRKFARFMTSDMGEDEAMKRAIKARRLMEIDEHFTR